MNQNPTTKSKSSKWIWIILIIVLLVAGGVGWYYFIGPGKQTSVSTQKEITAPPDGWRAFNGCVATLRIEPAFNVNFQYYVRDEWNYITDGGCNAKEPQLSYQITYGSDKSSTDSEFVISTINPISEPLEEDYIVKQLPSPHEKYALVLTRTKTRTLKMGDKDITIQGISDADWAIIRQSLVLK